MRVGIVGSNGYIARHLEHRFQANNAITQIIGYDKVKEEHTIYMDLEDGQNLDGVMLEGIDVLIFTAAVSGPDLCAKQFDACWNINVTGTVRLIQRALDEGVKVLFFSSDAVFGPDTCVFDEHSLTNAVTPYGRMKKAVEDAFRDHPGFTAIRLSYVVSCDDRFTAYCLTCLQNGSEAEVFHPFYRCCVTLKDVCDTVEWICCNWDQLPNRVLNLAGTELVSRVRIADEINRVYSNKLSYRVTLPSQEFFVNRPQITQMRSLYLYDAGIIKPVSFTQKYRKELENLKP